MVDLCIFSAFQNMKSKLVARSLTMNWNDLTNY